MTNIIEIAAQAKEAGMSYGQYVAQGKDKLIKVKRSKPGEEIELDIENWQWTWAKIRKGYTDDEIAYKCGLTRYDIGRLYRTTPRIITLKRLCRGLNIRLACGDINSDVECVYRKREFYKTWLAKLKNVEYRAIGISNLHASGNMGRYIAPQNLNKIGKYAHIKIVITGDKDE